MVTTRSTPVVANGNGDPLSQTPAAQRKGVSTPAATHPLITLYLIIYNAANMIMWSVTLILIAKHYATGGKLYNLYDTISTPLYIAQTLALLEVIHSLLGIVRSPFVTALMQVSSRILLIYGILYQVPSARRYWGFTFMTVSWCIAEIPRYFFYLYTLISVASAQQQGSSAVVELPYTLKWIRYSLFLILYPTGISGEILEIVHSLLYIQQHHILSISMPNTWNLAVDYYYVCFFILLTYVPGSYMMYTHMLHARKRALSPAASQKKGQ